VIDTVPRPRPPYLVRQVTRHGAVVWYVRVGKGQRIRLRKDYGTPEFEAEYQAAISGTAQPARTSSVRAGSLSWLVERYRESTSWTKYSLATRRQRENIFKQVIATAGDKPVTGITRAAIVAGRDRRAKTPFQGRHFLDAMHGLFGWALDAQHVKSDPTHGVAYPAAPVTRSGPRPKCNNTNAAGPSAPDSGCGSTCCSIRVCAVAMPCAMDGSTFATMSVLSKYKRAAARSP